MNVLVTGGAGYIGSILVGQLLDHGHKVVVVDDFRYEQCSLNYVCHYSSLEIVKADVRNVSQIKKYIKNADVVIPLAALVGAPVCAFNPVEADSINRASIEDLFGLLAPSQYVIMPTTNSAYGDTGEDSICDEKSDLKPISKYAVDKVEIETKLMERERSVSFRLATVFGMSPRMRTDLLVNDFVLKAVRDGYLILFESHFKRNYIHVRDVSRAVLLALENLNRFCGEVFNVGLSTANLSKAELCERIKLQLPSFVFEENMLSIDPDRRNYVVSNSKIEAMGFRPQIDIDSGISELIKGYGGFKRNQFGNI